MDVICRPYLSLPPAPTEEEFFQAVTMIDECER